MPYPNYNYGMPKTAVAVGLASQTILAAVDLSLLGTRTGLMILNPSTNTGTLYFNLSTEAPSAAANNHQFSLAPGEWFIDEGDQVYQGQITGLMSVAETINLYVGVKPS